MNALATALDSHGGGAPLDLLVALLVGFLIGLDRERTAARKQYHLFAGVRTFSLLALAGAIPALMLERWGIVPLVVSFLAVAALTLVAYWRVSTAGTLGSTTETAALVTFLLGALAGSGQPLLAAGAGIAVTTLLTAKRQLEQFSRALSAQELDAVLELGVITCIVLPLLPNRGLGPWNVWNPFEIWLVVILVSAFSFAGFIASRLLGERRGLLVAGLGGALVSSTAVTVAMAHRSRAEPAHERDAAMAATLASAVMALRVAVLAGAAGLGILPRLLPALMAVAVVSVVAAWVIARGRDVVNPKVAPAAARNPFSLWAALSFALLYAAVLLLLPAARAWLGTAGNFLAAALSALVDVDAITIALSRGGPAIGGWRDPAAAVSAGIAVNTVVKIVIVAAVGRGRFRTAVISSLALTALACLAVAALVYFWSPTGG
jgi:uncharacterized membrane protein (DUF4010 family)